MRMRPVRLNSAVGSLFVVGSACFVLGSVPAYLNAVGGTADGVTYFVGSLFFTAASLLQLLQAQTPAMTGADAASEHVPAPVWMWAWLPGDRNWLAAMTQFPGTIFFNASTLAALVHNATAASTDRHVWRPDMFGSTLFLVSSAFGILVVDGFRTFRPRSPTWRIAWLNMAGSIFFMASAVTSFVIPDTGELVNVRISIAGTLLGAVCFLIGAVLMFPAWRSATSGGSVPGGPLPVREELPGP
ncbi:MAG: hypothetical protein L0H41_07935 [Microlunatus sp.]|nr:hypothetical protein [Microlunatus sp.]MDN5769665.1 hypothetical protein [Microlunatus sp.]